jgi:hypothetical protein
MRILSRLMCCSAVIISCGIAQVQVTPASRQLSAGQSQQFTASISGKPQSGVTWKITTNKGGTGGVGTISSAGLYIAPANVSSQLTVVVMAVTSRGSGKTAVYVNPATNPTVGVSLSPASVTLLPGKTQQFTATVAGTANTAVTWSVSPTVGTISSGGLYTAPATMGSAQTVTVTATSVVNTSKKATATVTITPPVQVSVMPLQASLTTAQTQQFTATVAGTTNTAVAWSVNGVSGGNRTVGTISSAGLYTAPASLSSPLSVTVSATSQQDQSKSAAASVMVTPRVTVSVSPGSTSLTAGQTQQFAATVTGAVNTTVTWSLSPAVGTISTGGLYTAPPTVSSAASVTVTATSAADTTKSANAVVSLTPATLILTTSSLPGGTTGAAYSAQLTATGGTAPYTWSIGPGQWPTGLGLSTTSGIISGTPSAAGTYNMAVQLKDAAGQQLTKTFSVVILAALAITASPLPDGTVGVPYSTTLTATGGTPPYTWSLVSGQLPPGITLAPSGALAGTPAQNGSYDFTAQAQDSVRAQVTRRGTIPIVSPTPGTIIITNADLPNGAVGSPYTVTLSASGGSGSYTWTVASGTLPAGLVLDGAQGTIAGTPTDAGWSDFFTLQAKDSSGNSGSLYYSIIVTPALDQYGGIVGQSCTQTGYFHSEKVGNRWWLCTPAGNRWWMTSVGGTNAPGGGCDASTGQCSNYPAIANSKYGDLNIHWGPQQNRRLQLWGFDSVGQLSAGYMYSTASCPGCDGWPAGQQPVKLPMTQTLNVSNYAAINLHNYADRPMKNMLYGMNKNYKGWPASVMDFFEPQFGSWMAGYFADTTVNGVHRYLTSPWVVGVFLDDTDWFWGMGAGPDFHTIPSGHTNSHVGYMTLITSPMQTFNPDPASRGVPALYTDAKVYSKTAMASPPSSCGPTSPCSLRDYLHKKYDGSITALNTAWGSNYTTFDSTGTSVAGEVIGTGDGTKTVFTHTLAATPVSPESILVSVDGVPQGGDCPWWASACQAAQNGGTIKGPAGTKILTGETAWASDLYAQDAQGVPAASFWVQVLFHFPAGSGHAASPSRLVGATYSTGNKRPFAVTPQVDSGHVATGYDVYMACRLQSSSTPAFGCAGSNDPMPAPSLQATNVPFGTDWGVPTTGLVIGAPLPLSPSTVLYANGQVQITFSAPPTQGQQITADYVASGWMYGTGLMDEDGRHTSWVGTNPICLSPALSCDGTDNPRPNSNSQLAADLDAWITQFAAQYFSTCRDNLKKSGPNTMYLGADTVGTWGVPARKEILLAAAPYVDALFTQWLVGLPDPATSNAIYQYVTKYLGDKPLMSFLTLRANPDSSVFRYPFNPVYWAPTQEQRGQMYRDAVNTMLTTPSYNGTYQWVGVNWWGLADFWPSEKTNFGLLSLNDNPYDGKSATTTIRKDPWGFPTGGEERDYGDATDYVKNGNSLWWTGLLKGSLPE